MLKKILSVVLTAVLSIMTVSQTLAATSLPKISSSKPIICYTIKSSGKVYAYTDKSLKKKTGGYIACSTDECKILAISGNALKVKYPVSKGTKTAWFSRSEFSSYNISKGASGSWTQSKKITTYRRSDGKKSFGYISAGDKCYKLSEKGKYTQVIYPISGGYKMGWVKTSEIRKKNESALFVSSGKLPSNIYLKQEGKSTCTLSSSAMMLRARKYLSGKSYSSITESSIKSTAWKNGEGLKHNWSYSGISVSHKSVSGISASSLKSLLKSHPEGIVLYCGKYPHAVFLTDYSGNTFYCADPYGSYSKKRIKLSSSLLGNKYGGQDKILSNVTAYWYVSKY